LILDLERSIAVVGSKSAAIARRLSPKLMRMTTKLHVAPHALESGRPQAMGLDLGPSRANSCPSEHRARPAAHLRTRPSAVSTADRQGGRRHRARGQVPPSSLPGFDRLFSFNWPWVPYALEILAWDYCFGLALLLVAPVFRGGPCGACGPDGHGGGGYPVPGRASRRAHGQHADPQR
jgi:hypothetical protein